MAKSKKKAPKLASIPSLEAEIKRLKERLDFYESTPYCPPSRNTERAQPVVINGSYFCSKCGLAAYCDGRCGDGPVLTCKCNSVDDYYWGTNR